MASQPIKPRSAKAIKELGDFYVQVEVPSAEDPGARPSQPPSELVPQGRLGDFWDKVWGTEVKKVKPDVMIKKWKTQVAQMQELVILSASKMSPHLPLESVSFSLTFDAEAQVWFFAKVGAAATVQITFKREAE